MANNKQTASQLSALIRNAQLPDSIDPELMADALDAILDEIPSQPATTEKAGLMSPDDKARLADAITETDVATHEKAGLMPVSDKKRLDGTECVVSIDDVVSHINLNTSNYVLPSTDDVDDRQATAPDGCELVYSTQDARLYARKPYLDGYMWYYYPQGRDLWGEPEPEVSGKGILPRAGYLFVCNNPASGHNGKLFVGRYVMRADGRKGTQLMQIPTKQSTYAGTDSNYIYSVGNGNDARCVMTTPNTKFYQEGGFLWFRKGQWTVPGEDNKFFSSKMPRVNYNNDGVMSTEVFRRLGAGENGAGRNAPAIFESSATTTEVTITYPNWATDDTRTFVLNRATSARAGVMTSAQYNKLTALPTAEQLRPAMQTVGAFDFVALPGSTLPVPQDNLKLGCEFLAGELDNIMEHIMRPYISYNGAWHALPASVENLGYIDTLNDSRLCFDADGSFVHLNPVMLFRIDNDYMIPSECNGIYAVSEDNYPNTIIARIITLQDLDRYLPNTAAMQASINALQTQLQEALARIAVLEG